MSKTRKALAAVVRRPRDWGKPVKGQELARPWWGLDTERDRNTGEFICGFAVTKDFAGRTAAPFTILPDLPPGTYWVWNLAYDIEGMMRDLANHPDWKHNTDNLWAMRVDGAEFPLTHKDGETVRCTYYHGKRFDWSDDGGRRVFLEASSFYGRAGLNKIAEKQFGRGKDKGVNSKYMSAAWYRASSYYRARVRLYCIKDTELVYDLLTLLEEGCKEIGEKTGQFLALGSTPGATARRFIASLGQFPEIVWATRTKFLKAYCGGRFELVKRGYFESAYQYDLASAYPWALSTCPFLTHTARQQFTREFVPDTQYGVYEVRFETDDYLGLAPQWRDNTRVYSAGEKRCWLTQPEVEYLERTGAKYRVLRGTVVNDPNATDAWNRAILHLFDLKYSNKGKPVEIGSKIILNSQYGVLIQLKPKSGKWIPLTQAEDPVDFVGDLALERGVEGFYGGQYYAPIYAATLTAKVRIRVLEAALQCGEGYVGSHTDSCLTTRKLPTSKGLGAWELQQEANELVVTKTGMYAMDGVIKARGINRGAKEDLWATQHQRNVRASIKSAKTWNEVSIIRTKTVENNLVHEKKREWLGEFSPQTILDRTYIDSKPLKFVECMT